MDKLTFWQQLWLTGAGAWIVAFVNYLYNRPARQLAQQAHQDGQNSLEKDRLLKLIERLEGECARYGTQYAECQKCLEGLRELAIRHGLELFTRRNERVAIFKKLESVHELLAANEKAAAVALLKDLIEQLKVDVTVPEIDLGA